jgi:TldD protein
MFVESKKPLTNEQLRKALISEAKNQGKEYGYLFVSTVGGFTMTGRYMPNAFNVTPTEVYRIYTDGRPDELVRGVDLVGTPLSIFSNIEAAGKDYGLFTGTCGAESGGVPVSTVCPTVFVKQIETQRKEKNQNRLPILPRP